MPSVAIAHPNRCRAYASELLSERRCCHHYCRRRHRHHAPSSAAAATTTAPTPPALRYCCCYHYSSTAPPPPTPRLLLLGFDTWPAGRAGSLLPLEARAGPGRAKLLELRAGPVRAVAPGNSGRSGPKLGHGPWVNSTQRSRCWWVAASWISGGRDH